MDISFIAKVLVFAGIAIVVFGILIWGGDKIGLPFGKLPGDISVEHGSSGFYFPIVTSIVLSIVLTIVINVLLWLFRK